MTEQQFINSNLNIWKALEESLASVGKKGYKRTKKEVDSLLNLYSITLENLTYAKTNYPESNITAYLNELSLKAHNTIYVREKLKSRNIIKFLTSKFREEFQKSRLYVAAAFICFMIGGILAYLLCINNPSNIFAFLPREMTNSINVNGPKYTDSPLSSSQIMTNNIKVAFLAFAVGIIFCILTFIILFQNGAIIGALIAFVHVNHLSMLKAVSLLAPHGFIELFAIFISGGAGFMLGYSLINPGKYKRIDAIKIKAKSCAYLILGVIIMLIIAGTLEGFVTPSKLSPVLKIAVGLLTAVVMFVYFNYSYKSKSKSNNTEVIA